MAHNHRTWIEISSAALRHNLGVFQRVIGPHVGILPIVKSNAYGHGVAEVASILKTQRHAGFGVAYGQEALHLRAMKYRGRIVVLSFWQTRELPELIRKNVELVVWDRPSLEAVIRASKHSKVRPKIHLKLDSGTSRIGFTPADIGHLQKRLPTLSGLRIVGVFSHLANSEEQPLQKTKNQIRYFTTLESRLDLESRVARHLACTASIIRYPEARFGFVRLGIGLYGLWPSSPIKAWTKANLPGLALRPVMTWKSRISQVKRVPRRTAVGYGGTWVAKKPSSIATIPVGYGDGYRRPWSNRAWVMVGQRRAPVIGRVSMNLLLVNVTAIPSAHRGQEVTLLGPGITVDDLSVLASNTINYEITTAIHPDIPRSIV